jgi:hypothetical protein
VQNFTLLENWSIIVEFFPSWNNGYKDGRILFSLFKDVNNYLEIQNCNNLYIIHRVIDGVWKPFSLLKPSFMKDQGNMFMLSQNKDGMTLYLYCDGTMIKTTADCMLPGEYKSSFGHDFSINNSVVKFIKFLSDTIPESDVAAFTALSKQAVIKAGQRRIGTFRIGQRI